MDPKFDLLGDPIPEGRGKAGRTGHIPTAENARKIRTLLVAGMKPERIAQQMGISVPTLRKHYFQNGKVNAKLARQFAIAEMRARKLLRLDEQADKGNVSAIRTMSAEMDRIEREIAEDAVGKNAKPKEKSTGVKRQREVAGFEADDELARKLQQEADERVH
jgi:hypothetical protein